MPAPRFFAKVGGFRYRERPCPRTRLRRAATKRPPCLCN
ncbi:hypothetical protein L538_4386 [Bordetella hinzii 4161]|nr:hypothetical protein L538_4386 [Bordetella hinzii 4161]